MKNYIQLLLVALVVLFVGCNSADTLTISGTISEAAGDTLRIKSLKGNKMTEIDSKVLSASGRFKFSLEKQAHPEFHYLQINNGGQLLIVRDSLDNIVVESSAKTLKSATIEGSKVSTRIQEMVMEIEALRADYVVYLKQANEGNDADGKLAEAFVEELNVVKTSIKAKIFEDPKSYFAYYALFQRLSADNLLFSPFNAEDYQYFAAVATSYDLYHKEDPRTTALYEMVTGVLTEKRNAALQQMIKDAPSTIPNVVMNDINGKEQDLSKLKGKVVILNFWASRSEESRMMNKALLSLYNKYRTRGLDVYQVSADKSKLLWEDAMEADKLPWINVCDFKEGGSQAFITYNVKAVPTTFLIGRNGEMINKFTTIAELEKAIKAAL